MRIVWECVTFGLTNQKWDGIKNNNANNNIFKSCIYDDRGYFIRCIDSMLYYIETTENGSFKITFFTGIKNVLKDIQLNQSKCASSFFSGKWNVNNILICSTNKSKKKMILYYFDTVMFYIVLVTNKDVKSKLKM